MRRTGCCTWIFGDNALADTAARVAKAGLNGVELFGDTEGIDPKEAAKILNGHGLEIFSLTPGDADISHPNADIRAKAIEYYKALSDFAAELGNPLISCHGQVGRIAPIASQAEEDALLQDSVAQICEIAKGQTVVFEILNRYETHQVHTVAEGLALMKAVGADNLKLLPDAYHMNIEEADPAGALRAGGDAIGLYHAADSNRMGIGAGNTDFAAQIRALDDINYQGPVIFEVNAPGPNPFTPDKGEGFRDIVVEELARSRRIFNQG
ncbi:sugar phosphate isomerase/epimerase family protein [Halocynthiibacter sp.]|uniref:sugar phosphate isomerase/epimerase family protein n=1 Tax=Halocynthiibacter sp. TaxID=1979210 RepID=UPI003C627718